MTEINETDLAKAKKNSLTEGNVYKKLLSFAIPFLISNLLQAVYSTVDLLIVSWYSDKASIAAVNVGGQVMVLVTNVLVGFSIGISVLIAYLTGRKQTEKISDTIGTSLSVMLIVSIVLNVILFFLATPLLKALKVEETAFAPAYSYLTISFLGIAFINIYNVISGANRGMGSTKPALLFIGVSGILNLILDIFFVKNLQMGAKGAAIATVISQGLACALAIIHLFLRRKKLNLSLKIFKPDKMILKRVFKLGMPSALQQLVIQLSFLLLMGLINSDGINTNLAYGYVTKVSSFVVLPFGAIMSAISAMTGQNLGAGEPKRATKALKAGIIMSFPFAILMFAFINIFAEPIYSIFTKDAEILKKSAELVRYMGCEYITLVAIFCMHGFITGAGKATFVMINAILSSLAIRIPLSFILFKFMGANGIGLSIALSPIVPTIIAAIYMKSGKWKNTKQLEIEPQTNHQEEKKELQI